MFERPFRSEQIDFGVVILKIVEAPSQQFWIDLFLVNSERVDDIKGVGIVMHFFNSFDNHKLFVGVVRIMINRDAYY